MSTANSSFSLEQQPEVFASDATSSVAVHRAVSRGQARRIARGLYTRNLEEPLESVVRTYAVQGLLIKPRRGPGPLPSDMPHMNGLWYSSRPRAWLDNMRPSRHGSASRAR